MRGSLWETSEIQPVSGEIYFVSRKAENAQKMYIYEYNRLIMRVLLPIAVFGIIVLGCRKATQNTDLVVHSLRDTSVVTYGPYLAFKLPIHKGIPISNPIQLAQGPGGKLFAANQTGEVYALHDTDGDGLEDSTALYCNVRDFGLRSPAGIAHKGDTVFIATAQQIRAFRDTDADGRADVNWVVFDRIPESGHPYEWTSALTIGPDGWLYCALATDSWNAAPSPDPDGYRGSMLRISPNGKEVSRIATGVRSVYGMAFNQYGDLFFTDNEGGGNAVEELNLLTKGGFFGHNPAKYPHDSVIGPAHALQTEVAPSGIQFNPDQNDFGGSAGDLFVAFYGPGERWNRGAIARIDILRQDDGSYSFTESPVAEISKISDLQFGADGNLYVARHGMADYWYNAVYANEGALYKLVYDPSYTGFARQRGQPDKTLPPGSVEAGRQLFAEAACLGCHQVDGSTELLGPNLRDIGRQMSREEILDDILNPSARIKPSMIGQKIVKRDGQTLLGRVISSSDVELSIMLVGNSVIAVPRKEILQVETMENSLMYEGLLEGMPDADVNALLDYIVSLNRRG